MAERTSTTRSSTYLGALLLAFASAAPAISADLAIVDVAVYPAPGAARLDHANVIIRDGKIRAIAADADVEGLPVLDGRGLIATAGWWNCHVHLMEPALNGNAAGVLHDMLLQYGFTSVLDTGSVQRDTQHLIDAINAGELDGPRIVTAAGGLVYTDGTPVYLPGIRLPEVAKPAEAEPLVRHFLDQGADGIKIFTGSFMSPTETILLPPAIIRAITDAAHARHSFVVSHPTSREGLENAVGNGVDVLAHTAPSAGPLGAELVRAMLENDVALIPTLKLWSWELGRAGVPEAEIRAFVAAGVGQLQEYASAGGEILFGTDVGYMRDFDTTDEFRLMQRAGLDFADILAALTTRPAHRFAGESGTLEPGAPGDVVLLREDPARDPTALARVAYTIRGGRIVYDGT